MPFTTRVLLEPIELHGTPQWRTAEPLNFDSVRYRKHYVVPADFISDLASVPRWIPIGYALFGGRGNAAAVVHDWLYRNGMRMRQIKDKQEADDVFLEAMLDSGVPSKRAHMMYQAVNWCGASAFKADPKNKKPILRAP